MQKLVSILAVAVMSVSFVACSSDSNSGGGGGSSSGGSASKVDNVAACNAWKTKMDANTCGTVDMSTLTKSIDCSAYSQVPCDIAAYFTCLTDGYKCTDGTVDVSGWANCASKATCK